MYKFAQWTKLPNDHTKQSRHRMLTIEKQKLSFPLLKTSIRNNAWIVLKRRPPKANNIWISRKSANEYLNQGAIKRAARSKTCGQGDCLNQLYNQNIWAANHKQNSCDSRIYRIIPGTWPICAIAFGAFAGPKISAVNKINRPRKSEYFLIFSTLKKRNNRLFFLNHSMSHHSICSQYFGTIIVTLFFFWISCFFRYNISSILTLLCTSSFAIAF